MNPNDSLIQEPHSSLLRPISRQDLLKTFESFKYYLDSKDPRLNNVGDIPMP